MVTVAVPDVFSDSAAPTTSAARLAAQSTDTEATSTIVVEREVLRRDGGSVRGRRRAGKSLMRCLAPMSVLFRVTNPATTESDRLRWSYPDRCTGKLRW